MSTAIASPILRSVPGPRGHLIFGSVRAVQADPLNFYTQTNRDYGHLVRLRAIPTIYWYMATHPDDIEQILQSKQSNYPKGMIFNKPMRLLIGQGLFTSEGDFWRRQRRLAQPAFHKQRIGGLAGKMTNAAEAMVKHWRKYHDQPFDVAQEMSRLTLQIASETLFSVDVSSDADLVGQALRSAFEYLNYRLNHTFAIPEIFPTPRNRRFFKDRNTLDKIVYKIIDQRRREGKDKGDLLSMLLMARDEETGEGMSDEQLRDEVLTILIAGHDTTAATLSWIWYLLGQHPEVESRLHAELAAVLNGRAPTVEDLGRLTYTKMVIDEAMRLYPPAWGLPRQALKDDELSGHHIPAGAMFILCTYVTHRHPDFWDNPEQFDPERFTPARSANRPRFAYFPFGGGARQCIGNNFALMEASLLLATLAQHYRLQLIPEHRVVADPTFTLRPRHGVMVKAQPR